MSTLPAGTVTFLFTDIEGSTRLLEAQPDAYRGALTRHHALLGQAVDAHGGVIFETVGEGAYAAFANPTQAARAALDAQIALQREPWGELGRIRVRMGLHTGEVELQGQHYFGTPLYRCARLMGSAHGEQVVLSEVTAALVREGLPPGVGLKDLGEQRPRDLARPERIYQLVAADLPGDFPALRTLEVHPNNIPTQLTTFIGRGQELAEVGAALARMRLLTLTGPGGTGKTRFAIQLAAELIGNYDEGAFFVGLAPVFAPTLVIPTIAQVLGVPDPRGRPPLESLKDYLRDKRLLLILDNFEQVTAAGPQLVELLAACPRLTLLVTSRVALRLSGEHELQVPALSLPELGPQPADTGALVGALGRSEAVQLFVERARAVKADFALTEENAAAVAAICRRLDGLPLALELAAARVRLLPPRAMLARLSGRPAGPVAEPPGAVPPSAAQSSPLQFLTGGARDLPDRQQTLRATIGWSYDLLDSTEQALFRRLAAFVGGCTIEAAEASGTALIGDRRWALAPDEVLDGIESLVAKNLLRQMDGDADGLRFTMLETIRAFGLEQLERVGELRSLRRWHAEYYLGRAEWAEPLLRGPEQRAWLDRLEADHDNLRAALEWSLDSRTGVEGERGPERALRLAAALAGFWVARAYFSEGRSWLARSLAVASAEPSRARAKALSGAGYLAHLQRDAARARALLEPAVIMAREISDHWAASWALYVLGRVSYYAGDASRARALAEECLAEAGLADDRWLEAWGLHLHGLASHIAAEYPAAWSYYERSLQIRRELGHPDGIATMQGLMGMVAHRQGDYGVAHALIRDSLLGNRAVGSSWSLHTMLASYAALVAALGQPERAVRILGAVHAFGETIDVVPIPLAEALADETIRAAQLALGAGICAAALAAGRAMSIDEAVAEALAVEAPPAGAAQSAAAQAGPAPGGLSPREVEVLRLIARGCTTREMADALVVSMPTVERHITHLYTKIGARGRAEATSYALKHGLG